MKLITILAFVLMVLLAGCGGDSSVPPSLSPVPTLPPTPPTMLPATAVPTPIPDTGWLLVRDGLEQRIIRQPTYSLYILRLEPALFAWQIAYQPGQPQLLTAWQAQTGALIVLNGGYFTEQFVATGLIIVDGAAQGAGYGDFAGMLTIDEAGQPDLRWLGERPFAAHETAQYALQSFPLLVKPGGVLGYPEEDGRIARRTVIGRDGNGRFLLIAATNPGLTLHQLSQWLIKSDLALDIALNLDGGTSTGLLLADSTEGVRGLTAVPAVIAIYPK